jgi:hypothetical protein
MLSLVVALAAATTGCIYEDRSECVNTILLSYTGDGDTEIFNEKISRLDLYIFDENNRCIHYDTLSSQELADRKTEVLLLPGNIYHAVCIGNAENTVTESLYEGTIADTRLYHRDSDTAVASHDPLYQGGQMLVVPSSGNTLHTVSMNSSHVDMIVEVKGYNEPPQMRATRADGEIPLSVRHSDLPSWTDFTNAHSKRRPGQGLEREMMTQYPTARIDEDRYVFEYNVMRDISGTMLRLYDSAGEEIVMPGLPIDVEAYVAQYLVPNPELPGPYDSEGELLNEAIIPIEIEFTNVEVLVSIPGWAITPTTPEF